MRLLTLQRPAQPALTAEHARIPSHILAIAQEHRAEIVALLGSGGFGEAWLMERDGKRLVLKCARTDRKMDSANRMQNEGLLLKSLDLPGVPKLLQSGTENHTAYLLMEEVEGIPLRELLRSADGRDVPLQLIARMFQESARLMADVHRSGVIHGDVKLENILIGTRISLLDFGLGRREDPERTTMTLQGDTLGTHGYLDPQTIGQAEKRSFPSDIFGLGASFFELYTGQPLFTETEWHAVLAERRRVLLRVISENEYVAWHDAKIQAKRALFEKRSNRNSAMEEMITSMVLAEGETIQDGKQSERRRPTAAMIATKVGESKGNPYVQAWRTPLTENERREIAEEILQWRKPTSRRNFLAAAGACTIAGLSSLFALDRGDQKVVEIDRTEEPAPIPTIQCLEDELRINDAKGNPLLRKSLHEALRLESSQNLVWTMDLSTQELCAVLERMQPGLGAGMPTKTKYSGYVLRMKEDPENRTLFSLNRGCVLFDPKGFQFFRPEELAEPKAEEAAAFLQSFANDRFQSSDPDVDRKLITKVNTHVRGLVKNIQQP